MSNEIVDEAESALKSLHELIGENSSETDFSLAPLTGFLDRLRAAVMRPLEGGILVAPGAACPASLQAIRHIRGQLRWL